MPPKRRRVSARPRPATRGGAVGKSHATSQRDRGGSQEPVAEEPEPGAVAAVEPDEEEPGDEEVGTEIERVQRLDEQRRAQHGVLQRRLPGQHRRSAPSPR